jgi:hypothetical protein
MRLFLTILLGVILSTMPVIGEPHLSQEQIQTLLERYENGVSSGRFVYRIGKGKQDLISYIESGALTGIRQDVLSPVHQSLPEPPPLVTTEPSAESVIPVAGLEPANIITLPSFKDNEWGGGGFDQEVGQTWEDSGGWKNDNKSSDAEIEDLIQELANASEVCNYTEAKRLADLVLILDPENKWIGTNYAEIEKWAVKSTLFFKALNSAYEAIENEDFDNTVVHLRTALTNAASNCGQNVIVQTLLNQSIDASNSERDTAIARAKAEGAIHQQTFAQIQSSREAEKLTRESSKGGLTRGIMGILGTAVKVGALKEAGNLSSGDAISQYLQQEVMSSNPEMAQLAAQAQQLKDRRSS